jgi:dTDP-4-amino-4,6-dideoxygalactose transaminase
MVGSRSKRSWPSYPIITEKEHEAAARVLDSGLLQGFRASHGPYFLGGPEVRNFEDLVAATLHVQYAVSFSSATAALHGAVVATGVQPLDEVIVTPYSFNASAVAPLYHNAIPVFADVTLSDFGLDPASVEERITPRTRAIIIVHLFGIPAQMDAIMDIAHRHNLAVIEDSAQAPLARYKGRYTGTIGDCGIFSFVGEKNASCGEGGMLVTDNPEIARMARLVRNHGDALYEPMLGYNYRMTEIQAAIAIEQWKQLEQRNVSRRFLVAVLGREMENRSIRQVALPYVPPIHTASWYALPFYFYEDRESDVPRGTFVEHMNRAGIPFGAGYIKPLHLIPLFQRRAHFAYEHYEGDAQYYMGLCPNAEALWKKRLVITSVVRPPATPEDMYQIAKAMKKSLS